MKSQLLTALLLATAAPAIAQTSISTLPPPALVDSKVAALRDNALNNDHYAWDITEGLTTEVGQRLAATEAEARARAWAVQKLTAMGFSNVHVEPFDMPVWVRGAESAEIVSPFPQKMVIAALGFDAEDLPQLWQAPELETTSWGTVAVERKSFATSLPGVYAAGDIVRGASLVVWAIKEGRDAADAMHAYIQSQALAPA